MLFRHFLVSNAPIWTKKRLFKKIFVFSAVFLLKILRCLLLFYNIYEQKILFLIFVLLKKYFHEHEGTFMSLITNELYLTRWH